METTKLRRFAQYARRTLMELVDARLQLVLQAGSAARRENAEAIKKLEEAIKSHGEAKVVERVAYIWFNRFCALRFMDVNRYTRIGVVSPAEGQFQPEVLAEAKMGHIDDETVPEKIRQQIVSLLAGNAPSHDPQGEAYRLLVVAACNAFHRAMPFLFERIDDYTELLMPDDLLSGNSILAYIREAMTPDACKDPQTEEPIVEVIGWLYQFYISEKKDLVFEGLKKNQKITPENIPAATQLFTPHWIVRYLVENSLGRLWLLNRPGSKLAEQMEYYIAPEQSETDFLKIASPEEIKICDPACGSGHMLTYAFDLLYAIYEEEGVDPAEIPEKILTHNLYGIEIDERAGELAAFALTMKARARQRRFFNKAIKPNICVLGKVVFSVDELDEYITAVGRDLFTLDLHETLKQFEKTDNFGSLIRPKLTSVQNVLLALEGADMAGNLFLKSTHDKVIQVLRMADSLSPRYHVVIANPPYMGRRNMNSQLSTWAKNNYPNSHFDLFSMFMERSMEMLLKDGWMGMINLPSWLFLSSFSGLRSDLVEKYFVESMLHMGRGIFGVDWGSVAFVIKKSKSNSRAGNFFKLHKKTFQLIRPEDIERLFLFSKLDVDYRYDFSQYRDASGVNAISSTSYETGQKLRFITAPESFKKIPGNPIAYWLPASIYDVFESGKKFGDIARPRVGMQTANNDFFLRLWWEVAIEKTSILQPDQKNWVAYSKGGEYRKWWGNNEYILRYFKSGELLKKQNNATLPDESIYSAIRCTWSDISAGKPFAARRAPTHSFYDIKGHSFFPSANGDGLLAYSNSNFFNLCIGMLNPGLNFQVGDARRVPAPEESTIRLAAHVEQGCVSLSKLDWDSNETSWDFQNCPLLQANFYQPIMRVSCKLLRAHWQVMTLEMQRLEEDNNRIFIEAYGLEDELTSEVSLEDITLTCNPYYRYGGEKTEAELEAQLQADTMAEFLSYAVGCMFGRYSLDKPGLVLANQGETLAEYLRQIPEPSFMPDEDNVIPLLDGEWFADDVTERFRTFLRVTFGEEHYEENLAFIEQSLGKDVRKYFIKDFYTDHVKRYKKRPIYWLFASPKGTFSALIYLHRYRPDTVSVVLQYLRDFRKKLAARLDYLQQVGISTSASQSEKTKANKEVEAIKKQLLELDDYERDTLYPLATEQVVLDLDDGVKVNYLKLGPALKKIVGLDAKGED